MISLRDDGRIEPIYLCKAHASELGERTAAGGRSVSPDNNSAVAGSAKSTRRHRYIVLLASGLVLAGLWAGLQLARILEMPPAVPLPQSPVAPGIDTEPRQRNTQVTGVAVGGDVDRRVLPDVPQSAKDTIRGTIMVIVRVSVDAAGDVLYADVEYPGPSKYFRRLALEAAEGWKFRPPIVAEQSIPSDWTLRFEFTRDETRAIATQNTDLSPTSAG